jgi:hypothetical protein
VLVYDADDSDAAAIALRLRPILPLGYPVVALADLPSPPPPGVNPASLRGTVGWLDVDGHLYTGRRAVGHALVACEGADSAVGWLMLMPVVGALALAGWRATTRDAG